MASEVSFEVVDTESGAGRSEVVDQDVGEIDHKHGQIRSIVNRSLVDVHKIFQAPKLFGVTEVELDLETKAIIVDQFVESQRQVAAEKDNPGHFLSVEVGFDNDDHIEFIGDEFVPQGHLIDVGVDAIQEGGLFKIFVGDMAIIQFGSIFFVGPPLFLWPVVGKVEGRVIAQFGDEMQTTLSNHLEGIIVAKRTVQDTVDRSQINPKQQQQTFEHPLDLK